MNVWGGTNAGLAQTSDVGYVGQAVPEGRDRAVQRSACIEIGKGKRLNFGLLQAAPQDGPKSPQHQLALYARYFLAQV